MEVEVKVWINYLEIYFLERLSTGEWHIKKKKSVVQVP